MCIRDRRRCVTVLGYRADSLAQFGAVDDEPQDARDDKGQHERDDARILRDDFSVEQARVIRISPGVERFIARGIDHQVKVCDRIVQAVELENSLHSRTV